MPRKPPSPDITGLLGRMSEQGEDAPSLPEMMHITQTIRASGPAESQLLDRFLIQEHRRLSQGIMKLKGIHEELRSKLHDLLAPPWPTAILLQMLPPPTSSPEAPEGVDPMVAPGASEAGSRDRATDLDSAARQGLFDELRASEPQQPAESPMRALVSEGRADVVVNVDPDADIETLLPGDQVLLNPGKNVLVGKVPYTRQSGGELAQFERVTEDGRLVIRSRDEESLAIPSARLDLPALTRGDLVRWDRNLSMVFEKVARSEERHLFLEDTPRVTFAEIGGLDEVIERIKRTILLHRDHADKARLYNLRSWHGLLLTGPPGNGKTLLACALANWLASVSRSGRSRFMGVKPGQLLTKWYGESERNIRDAFAVARRAALAEPDVPVVMFFDEIDSIGRARSQRLTRVGDQVLPAFMEELDGITARGNVLVLAATNRADALDPALMRAGRLLDDSFEVPRPGRAAAREILACHLQSGVPVAEIDECAGDARSGLIDLAVARLYSRNGRGALVQLVLRDGSRRKVMARDLLSGASIANIVRTASELACLRDVETGEAGVRSIDLFTAIERELAKLTSHLTPLNAHLYVAGLPEDIPVVSIERPSRRTERESYLRIA